MAIKYIKRTVSLDGGSVTEDMQGSFFNDETSAHVFIIDARRDGAAFTLTGTVSAIFHNANNTDVALTGSLVSGAATVTLSDACYQVSGRFTLTISVDGDVIYECNSRIKRRSSGTAYDPSQELTVAALAAAVADMRSATTAANTAAGNAAAASAYIAPSEASSTASAPHAAGEYFIYNGVLYVATADIASGATITPNTNCRPVPKGLGGEVEDVTGALDQTIEAMNLIQMRDRTETIHSVSIASTSANHVMASGTATSSGGRNVAYYSNNFELPAGDYTLSIANVVNSSNLTLCLQDRTANTIIASVSGESRVEHFTLSEAKICAVGFNVTNGTAYTNVSFDVMLNTGNEAEPFVPPSTLTAIDRYARTKMDSLEKGDYHIYLTPKFPNPSSYSNLLSKIRLPGHYVIASSAEFTDKPVTGKGAMMEIYPYNNSYVYQIYHQLHPFLDFTRIVSNDGNIVYPWNNSRANVINKVLAFGDSLCEGYRNGGKGYVGLLGYNYLNKGHGGDSLAELSGRGTIYKQIAGNALTYNPDVVIANGGFNDYNNSALLGQLPTHPVASDTEAGELNTATVSGGLQMLLWRMIKYYPKAQRYFMFTHRTLSYPWTQCSAGYTQTDLHDFCEKICRIYSTSFIDVYNESMMNTAFDCYVSDIAYNTDNSVTETEYCDSDGIHPLNYGYKECYVPIILQALNTATWK